MKNITAVLIQAHNNPKYILKLALTNQDVSFFVHIDKKNEDAYLEIKRNNLNNIILIENRINVSWGGVSQIKATLRLLNTAYYYDEFTFFHLMSGECLPLRSFKSIESEWTLQPEVNYIESREHKGNEWRLRTMLPFSDTSFMRSFLGRVLKRMLRVFSKLMRTTSISPDFYFFGSQWFSVNRAAVSTILKIHEDENFFSNFENITCSDEHAFQILVRKYGVDNIADDNRRYIEFYGSKSSPEYLSCAKIDFARKKNYWFARKVDENTMLDYISVVHQD